MFKLISLSIVLSACNSRHPPSPSVNQSDNAAWIHDACPNKAQPTFVMGKKEAGCCPPFNGFIPPDRDNCVGIHDIDDPHDNFCEETPFKGTLIIEPTGQWWCCSAGQCGH